MNHSLTERVTRLLAFMLRHQPEQFDLEVDAFGFADIEDVLDALSERVDDDLEVEDLEQAIDEGSRPRYEIVKDRIRALYGHSIAVEPGEPAQPPELLYVGLPTREAERAAEHGLRSGRRRFLHLALTAEDAMETGRRSAVEYNVITVYALDGWEDGINFYDRKSLFLAEEIPINLLEVGPVHTDGQDPAERDGRRGRGGSRSDGRGGRGGGRDRGGSHDRGGRDSRGRGGRGRGRSSAGRDDREPESARDDEQARPTEVREDRARGDGGRTNRERDGGRGKSRERRPSRAPRGRSEREEVPTSAPSKPSSDTIAAAPKAPAKPASGFGTGIFEEKPKAKPKRAAKPKKQSPEKVVAAEEQSKGEEQAAKPAESAPSEPPSSFGAGL